jgi:hypothetical protein
MQSCAILGGMQGLFLIFSLKDASCNLRNLSQNYLFHSLSASVYARFLICTYGTLGDLACSRRSSQLGEVRGIWEQACCEASESLP